VAPREAAGDRETPVATDLEPLVGRTRLAVADGLRSPLPPLWHSSLSWRCYGLLRWEMAT
jgi:hypothetical protein